MVAASLAATEGRAVLGRRAGDWTPAELGVHRTIVVDDMTGPTPYVLRNHDTKLREALTELRQPGAGPQLVIVVGTSCSGKTRTLYEAVNAVLPDWTLARPGDIDELTRMLYDAIPVIACQAAAAPSKADDSPVVAAFSLAATASLTSIQAYQQALDAEHPGPKHGRSSAECRRSSAGTQQIAVGSGQRPADDRRRFGSSVRRTSDPRSRVSGGAGLHEPRLRRQCPSAPFLVGGQRAAPWARATVKLNIMPLCMCSAMWQWAIHRPGLVTSNKMSTT